MIRISELDYVIPCDLETAGLDEQNDQVLEVHARSGSIRGGKFVEQVWATTSGGFGGSFTRVLPIMSDVLSWHPAVIEMHTKNGLLAEAHKLHVEARKKVLGDRSLNSVLRAYVDDVDTKLARMFPKLEGESKWTLLGNSVHFDLRFVRRLFPRFAKNLSHRVIDISAIRMFTESLGLPYEKGEPAHRATEDVDDSIRLFAEYHAFAAGYPRKPLCQFCDPARPAGPTLYPNSDNP